MPDKTRVAFVGTGGIADAHLKGLSIHPDVTLVAFCDVNSDRAEAVAAQHDGKAFTDAATMFDAIAIDAVYFCLPPFAHGSEIAAVERGIPLFVEKPVDLDLDRARRLDAVISHKGLMATTGYMNRYRRSVNTVRELLVADPAIFVTGGWITGTPANHPWWTKRNKSGGQFHEQVSHTIDLVRYLCGDVVEVHAMAATGMNVSAPAGYDIDDASVVSLRCASGAVATLWGSCIANAGGGGITLNVYAHGTTAAFTGWEQTLRLRRTGQDILEIEGEPDIFAVEDAAFIRAVRQQDPTAIRATYHDGLKAIEISLGALESARTGHAVHLGGSA